MLPRRMLCEVSFWKKAVNRPLESGVAALEETISQIEDDFDDALY